MSDNIFNYFNFPLIFRNEYGDTLEDIMMCSLNENIMDIRLSLTLEVIELYEDKGYSYDEIISMIDNINFDKEYNLSDEEKDYLKRDAKKVLDIRVSLRNKNKTKIKEIDKYE